MSSLFHRVSGSLAVKSLPALYGVGLILLVVRVIPLGDFGRYGIAIAYVNLIAALSRGLWGGPLILRAARGDREELLAPAFWLSLATAVTGAAAGLILLPLLKVGWQLSCLAGIMLIVLVPRDLALNLTQAASRVWTAFVIEAGYFGGGLLGFVTLAALGKLNSAETVMLVNVVSAALSAVLGLYFEPCILHPGKHGNWQEIIRVGRWIGVLSLGEVYLQQGDALIVGIFFSAEAIAPYIAARTLLRMYTLLSQAINFLVLPHASRSMASGQVLHLRQRVRTVIKWLLLLLVPVNVLIWVFSPWVFPAILGAKYELAVPFFRLMILATFLEPVYSVLANAIVGIGKPQKVVPVQLTGLILNAGLNFVLLPLTGLKAAAIVLVATYGAMAILMRRLARTHLVPEGSPV